MNDIDDLGRRITAALDKMAQGLEQLDGQASAEPDAEMLQALEDERTANAQLQERVRALKEKAQNDGGDLREKLDGYDAKWADLDVELQRVRRANQELSDACAALCEANAQGVGDPELINKAMEAELEALRASRAADVAEASAILSELQPLVDTAGSETTAEGV